jgi:hypothetical protein
VSQVQALLGPDVVLVGQSVKSDVAWMQLEEVWAGPVLMQVFLWRGGRGRGVEWVGANRGLFVRGFRYMVAM